MVSSVSFSTTFHCILAQGIVLYELIFIRKPALHSVLYQFHTEASANNYTDYLSSLTYNIIKLQIEAFEEQYSEKINKKIVSEARNL